MAALKAAWFGRSVAVIDPFPGTLSSEERIYQVLLRAEALLDAGVVKKKSSSEEVEQEQEDESTIKELSVDEQIEALLEKPDEEELVDPYENEIFKLFKDENYTLDDEQTSREAQFKHKHIKVIKGSARFVDMDEIAVCVDGEEKFIEAKNVIIATGSRPLVEEGIPYDQLYVFDIDSIFDLENVPRRIAIVGSNEIACQSAAIFALMGSSVTLLCAEASFLFYLDTEIYAKFTAYLEALGVEIVYNEYPESLVLKDKAGKKDEQEVHFKLKQGSSRVFDALLFAEKRKGATEGLDCKAAGITMLEHGFVQVDEMMTTSVGHIFAVGACVQAPVTEAVDVAQGLAAVVQTFGLEDTEQLSDTSPVVINTYPQIAYYGWSEEQLRESHVKFLVGRAEYEQSVIGRRLHYDQGYIKLLVCKESHVIFGVHAIGPKAGELVYFGTILIENQIPVSKITGTIFDSHSVHALYKAAAQDVMQRLKH